MEKFRWDSIGRENIYENTEVAEVPGGWLFKVVREVTDEKGGCAVSVALQFVPKSKEKE